MTLTTLLSWCTFFFSFSYSYTKIVKNSPPHNPRDCWQGLRLGVWSERMGLRCPIPGEGLDSLSKYWIMKKSWSRVWSGRKRGSKPFYKDHKVRWSLPLPAQKQTKTNITHTKHITNQQTNTCIQPNLSRKITKLCAASLFQLKKQNKQKIHVKPFYKDYKAWCSHPFKAQKTK